MKTLRVTLSDIVGGTGGSGSTAVVHARYVTANGRGRDVHLTDGTIVVPVRREVTPGTGPERFDFTVIPSDDGDVREADRGFLTEVSWTVTAPEGGKAHGVRRVVVPSTADAVVQLGLLSEPTPAPAAPTSTTLDGGDASDPAYLLRMRRDTTAGWEATNPVLSAGEPGVDLTTGEQRIGDGVTAWSDLPPGLTAKAAVVAPSLHLYESKTEHLRRAMILSAGTVYAVTHATPWTVSTSANFGTTWTDKGNLPAPPRVMVRSHTTGTLLAIEDAIPARAWRSTDDGVNWALVATFNFPPLGSQGAHVTESGNFLVGEYGNVGTTVYRVMRSTNDGATWTAVLSSPGLEPSSDPGHIHSVTYDHVENRYLAFMDRPVVAGVSGPRLYSSADEGGTWALLGEADELEKPNFVAPMYFANYIAWGSDNQRNGVISRIRRADFYAGRFHLATDVATVNNKATYHTFPLSPDVWAMSTAAETIGGETPGSFGDAIYLVSDDGAVVSGGFESFASNSSLGTLAGSKATFPSVEHGELDHAGRAWVNLNVGYPYNYVAVPFTQGQDPTLKRADAGHFAPPIMPPGSAIRTKAADGSLPSVIELDQYGQMMLENKLSASATRPRIVFRATEGDIQIYYGATLAASIGSTGLVLRAGQVRLGNGSGPLLTSGTGSPEGVVTSTQGGLYVNFSGGAGTTLYVKQSGTGNTGWVGK